MGYFSGGQFNLTVSLRYQPDVGEVDFWRELMREVSRILYDATDGAHAIGNVFVCTNRMGGKDADIWVWDCDPGNPSDPGCMIRDNSTDARLWTTGSVDIRRDSAAIPSIIAHELAHYLYDLRDEYLTNNGIAVNACQNNPATGFTLMGQYSVNAYTRWRPISDPNGFYVDWRVFFPAFKNNQTMLQVGQPSEFCYTSPLGQVGAHDPNPLTQQNILNNHQSCWTYITNDANHNNLAYALVAPGSGGPTLSAPTNFPPLTLTELIPVQRFMLVLDRSGSMLGAKLDQLKVGANFWVDYVNVGEELGLTSFSTAATLDSAMSPTPATSTTWRNERHTIIDGLVANGSTAIGDAMRLGLNDILAGGRACSQVMILFTDGLQNSGVETAEAVLPDLIASGVRCYTIGLGNDQDATVLSNIAEATRGRYYAIDGNLPPDEAAAVIADYLAVIAGESRADGGIVSFRDLDTAKPIPGFPDLHPLEATVEPIPFMRRHDDRDDREQQRQRIESVQFPIDISAGSTHCTLGVLWKQAKQRFNIRVYDPDGTLLEEGKGVRLVQPDNYPYVFFEIDEPKQGTWHVEVFGNDIRAARMRTLGFEVNPRIRFEVTPLETHIKSGSEIRIQACLVATVALPDVELTGWIRNPNDDWHRFGFTELFPDKDTQKRGIYRARIPSMSDRTGQYLIVVDAYREKGTFEMKPDPFYKITPDLRSKDDTATIFVPRIRRRVLLSITADPKGRRPNEPRAGYNTKAPHIPKNHSTMLELWKKRECEVSWRVDQEGVSLLGAMPSKKEGTHDENP